MRTILSGPRSRAASGMRVVGEASTHMGGGNPQLGAAALARPRPPESHPTAALRSLHARRNEAPLRIPSKNVECFHIFPLKNVGTMHIFQRKLSFRNIVSEMENEGEQKGKAHGTHAHG